MKTITASVLQKRFAHLFPIPPEGYKITRESIVVAYMFPADLAINVSRGIKIEVNDRERARGRCQRCGMQDVLVNISRGDVPEYVCRRCLEDIEGQNKN